MRAVLDYEEFVPARHASDSVHVGRVSAVVDDHDPARALRDGGVRCVEVTLNSREPLASIAIASEHFAGTGMHIGAGTVLTADDVSGVADAGGSYIISPNFEASVGTRDQST